MTAASQARLRRWNYAREAIAGEGDVLTLQIDGVASFRERRPEEYAALVECSAFVNWRRIEAGERPVLVLAFG